MGSLLRMKKFPRPVECGEGAAFVQAGVVDVKI